MWGLWNLKVTLVLALGYFHMDSPMCEEDIGIVKDKEESKLFQKSNKLQSTALKFAPDYRRQPKRCEDVSCKHSKICRTSPNSKTLCKESHCASA
jgi:hypothetical protein